MRYVIMGRYHGTTEEIDEANSRREANLLLCEYRLAFDAEWDLWVRPMRRSL